MVRISFEEDCSILWFVDTFIEGKRTSTTIYSVYTIRSVNAVYSVRTIDSIRTCRTSWTYRALSSIDNHWNYGKHFPDISSAAPDHIVFKLNIEISFFTN